MLPVFTLDQFHNFRELVVEPFEFSRLAAGQRIMCQDRESDRRIDVGDDGVGELGGIDLAPGYGLMRRGPGKTAGIGPGVRKLDEVVVPLFLDAQHFLDLRFRLEHEVLGRTAADQESSRFVSGAFRVEDDARCLVDIAGLELRNSALRINSSRDVNESTGIVLAAKRAGLKTGTLLIGGGSPKNFTLQTEPQIQEVLRVKEEGHDYFIQFTDARPDTGGLSGATPHEAVTWGKVDPLQLPDAVVCYVDSTVAFPLLAHYALAKCKPRKLKRLYYKLPDIMELVKKEYWKHNKQL